MKVAVFESEFFDPSKECIGGGVGAIVQASKRLLLLPSELKTSGVDPGGEACVRLHSLECAM
jgi:hypothetical protein